MFDICRGGETHAQTFTAPLHASEPAGHSGCDDGSCGKIFWRRLGDGGKTPLLMLHGGPGAAHDYPLSMKALTDERPMIFYDQLGCGKADSPTSERRYTIQRSVDEVDPVRRALGLDRVILYGHYWGTILAIEYLCQGRDAGVEKLILAGAMASAPQCVAGMHRPIAGMPGGYRRQTRRARESRQGCDAGLCRAYAAFFTTCSCCARNHRATRS
ncbi:alpha/beta fold hydrolase [Sphingomonas sp. 22R3R2A-7]|uniref:alpha/beta fold hydrolase n=1 Tax=Sphingomonas sp. 22R3R2A-7 TaxID=3050230 RepID=UPI002FE3A5A5